MGLGRRLRAAGVRDPVPVTEVMAGQEAPGRGGREKQGHGQKEGRREEGEPPGRAAGRMVRCHEGCGFGFWSDKKIHTHTHPPNKDILKPNTHSMHIFPGGSAGKESACNAGDPGSVPQLGRSPGGGHGNPLQSPCLENPMDRGAWWATAQRVAKC